MALLAAGVDQGDDVVIPGFGFLAAANVVLHLRANPVFVEVDPLTWCANADTVSAGISPRTKAIVLIHSYGNVCPMDDLVELARSRDIPIIEDAAESFGSRWKGRVCGTFGLCGTLSFQATKTIATGEGGMVLTDDTDLYERMWLYRNHGMKNRRYWHELAGHNFRLTNLQAAVGCGQFERLEQTITSRRQMDACYRSLLKDIDGVGLQLYLPEVDPVVWAVAVRLDAVAFPQGRDTVIAQLAESGIETRPGFYAPSQMTHLYQTHSLPVCEAIASQIISLPSYTTITPSDIQRVCTELRALRK
jgi:perosamine synthetase